MIKPLVVGGVLFASAWFGTIAWERAHATPIVATQRAYCWGPGAYFPCAYLEAPERVIDL